jgi:para-nitrobenzyl esterase
MGTRLMQACAIVTFLAARITFAQAQVVVKTEAGLVASSGGDLRVWKGIPYAQPPTGDLRWKSP